MSSRRVCVWLVTLISAALAGCGGGGSTETTTTTTGLPSPPMPLVETRGSELVAGSEPFVAFGFNYGGPSGAHRRIFSFAHAGPGRMTRYIDGMRKARALGANTLRIYLQLFDFIKRTSGGRVEPRQRAVTNLMRVLDAAEHLGLYLDVTGNLVWVPGSAPHWYDRLLFRARWLVQARFWDVVSNMAAESPAVLCYELTSEPVIAAQSPSWYGGRLGGLNFVQLIVRNAGQSDTSALARQWIHVLSGAIRRNDARHLIGLGLLPSTTGPFAPRNVAGSLDVLMPHFYPENGKAAQAVRTVRAFAAPGKPVMLGETFLLRDDARTQRRFLLGSRRYLSGFLSFLRPFEAERPRSKRAVARYAVNQREFLSVRPQLLESH